MLKLRKYAKTAALTALFPTTAIALLIAPSPAEACPCDFGGAVRIRSLLDEEARCLSADIDIANVQPEGETNKQNVFDVRERNRKGAISKTTSFRLYEQGLLPAADFGGVRYGPTCQVDVSRKSRVRVLEAAYILDASEYESCARDLTTLAQLVVGANQGSCFDSGNGIVDAWEPMDPELPQQCFNEFGNPTPCAPLP